ncbi:hypothetical protein WG66_013878, partial [Moniliophthora roreri]
CVTIRSVLYFSPSGVPRVWTTSWSRSVGSFGHLVSLSWRERVGNCLNFVCSSVMYDKTQWER